MAHRSDEILQRLPAGPVMGAEIGVFAGATSARLLARPDLTLWMVDSWAPFIADGILIASREDQQRNYHKALQATDFASDRRIVIDHASQQAACCIDDDSLDFVFIDGDHSHRAVSADIRAWAPKLKAGGLLCGHDYANGEYAFGAEVKRAVDEYAKANGHTVELGGDYTWFIRL